MWLDVSVFLRAGSSAMLLKSNPKASKQAWSTSSRPKYEEKISIRGDVRECGDGKRCGAEEGVVERRVCAQICFPSGTPDMAHLYRSRQGGAQKVSGVTEPSFALHYTVVYRNIVDCGDELLADAFPPLHQAPRTAFASDGQV